VLRGVSPLTRQDRGLRPCVPANGYPTSAGGSVDHESVFRLLPVGRDGIYLFELEAQPGGPEGRSDNIAGSQPINRIERPRSVPALRSCLLVVDGTNSWFHSGNTSSRTRCSSIVPVPRRSAARFSFFIPGNIKPRLCLVAAGRHGPFVQLFPPRFRALPCCSHRAEPLLALVRHGVHPALLLPLFPVEQYPLNQPRVVQPAEAQTDPYSPRARR